MKEGSNVNKDRLDDFGGTRASPKSDDRPFSRIVQEIVTHLTEIVRSEIQLAREEVRADIAQAARASVFIAIGAVFGLYAFGFVLLGVVYALGTRVTPWLSALIVAVGVGVISAIFLQIGRSKMKQADLTPDKTIRSLQENVTWMKKQVR
jgi:Putative Actinobacterial Holin-X, holin superfamily III